ncbi:hypothetical protein OSSY52_11900 [Tepiditoga spiralis]|uniref:GGDEF domain-containing protein n=1 Tax=Tepiditoga spiralis TaxID=2108365 RepID=A0A7G1GBG2_9BACT|nr:diguanylate cyclase [Tepiditoga spiralis]BBE31049.1 hypothetical protein OSSY52_11900 [Tepiditoga spiralis]
MKKILLLILLFQISFIYSQSIKIGYYNDYPLCFKKNKTESGFFVDILNYISKDTWNINWIYGNLNNLLEELKDGKIDILINIKDIKEREKNYIFFKESFFYNYGELATSKNINLSSIKLLENKKIGVMKNDIHYIGEKGFKNLLRDFNINSEFIEFNNYDEIVKALKKHIIFAGVFSNSFLTSNNTLKKTGIVFSPADLTIATSKKSKTGILFLNDIKNKFKLLKDNKNSYYYTIFSKYFPKKGNIYNLSQTLKQILFGIFLIIVFTFIFLLLKYKNKKKIIKILNNIDFLEKSFDLITSEKIDSFDFFTYIYLELKKLNLIDFLGLGFLDNNNLNFKLGLSKNKIIDYTLKKSAKTKNISWYSIDTNKSLYIPNILKWKDPDYTPRVQDKNFLNKSLTILSIPIKTKHNKGVILFEKTGENSYKKVDKSILNTIAKEIELSFKYKEILNQLHLEKEKYKNIALKDSLTGLYTKYFFYEWHYKKREKLKRTSEESILVVIDVDKFKQINDNYGHLTGDKVLKSISKIILNNIRKMDFATRFGGDEFLIVFENTNLNFIEERMQKIKNEVKHLNFNFKIDISYGIEKITSKESIEKSIKKADEKMYKMKQSR